MEGTDGEHGRVRRIRLPADQLLHCLLYTSTSSEEEGEEFFKSEGETVLEALNNLSLLTGREPFYSHNYLVVFGRECA